VIPRAGARPAVDAPHFVCPHCGVDAQQLWQDADFPARGTGEVDKALKRAECRSCRGRSYWIDGSQVWPAPTLGAPPSPDLPPDLVALYDEARATAPISARAAAALLRFLVDRLLGSLGATDGPLTDRIASLAAEGHLPAQVIEGLDAVRVQGDDALPPGQIDPAAEDDAGVVQLLCLLVNSIVDTTLTLRRHRAELVGDRRPRPRGM
jgi:hypothetical protein